MVTERERTRRDEGRRRRRRCLRLFLEVIIDGGNVDIMLLIISQLWPACGLPSFIAGSSHRLSSVRRARLAFPGGIERASRFSDSHPNLLIRVYGVFWVSLKTHCQAKFKRPVQMLQNQPLLFFTLLVPISPPDNLTPQPVPQPLPVLVIHALIRSNLHFEYMYLSDNLSDEEVSGIAKAKALIAQPQLEDVSFESIGLEGNGWATLETTFMGWGRNSKLKKLDLPFNDIDDEGLQSLLRGIANCRNLVVLKLLFNNQITVAGLRSLSDFFQSKSCILESLNLDGVGIGNEGAMVLATGLVDYKVLKHLDLSDNAIGDEGILALVSGLTTAANTSLETLYLSGNAFTTAGIRSLSTLILSERSTLKELSINYMRIDDDGVSILADALTNNTSLERLVLDLDGSTIAVRNTFSRLLCDTSSINNIYLSNHTLHTIGRWYDEEIDCGKYFALNSRFLPKYRYLVPMCKILTHHPNLADMEPFYQWKLKFLPMIADWFQRASPCQGYFEESAETFQSRELSAMYRFIRGVPLLVADGYWSQKLKQVRVKKRKLEEEEEQLLKRLGRGKKSFDIE
jgi:hypothetical protein